MWQEMEGNEDHTHHSSPWWQWGHWCWEVTEENKGQVRVLAPRSCDLECLGGPPSRDAQIAMRQRHAGLKGETLAMTTKYVSGCQTH